VRGRKNRLQRYRFGALTVVERDSYDAWGERHYPSGADGNPPASQTTRGFTGEEELSDVGLVHLNGRLYDALIGRMISADPMVPQPTNGQAWNRYSYAVNARRFCRRISAPFSRPCLTLPVLSG
jgi:RHS repeat-associated protein